MYCSQYISNSDVMLFSNNDVILQAEVGVIKGQKIAVILNGSLRGTQTRPDKLQERQLSGSLTMQSVSILCAMSILRNFHMLRFRLAKGSYATIFARLSHVRKEPFFTKF